MKEIYRFLIITVLVLIVLLIIGDAVFSVDKKYTKVSSESESSTISQVEPTISAEPTVSSQLTVSPSPSIDPRPAKEILSNVIFLGDSTTYSLKYYGVLNDGDSTKQVWTPINGTLTLSMQSTATIYYPETNSEITIAEALELKKPECIVVTLGVNGVAFMNEEYFTSEYSKLVDNIQSVSPDTKIILNSLYPVAKNYERLDTINNDKINSANTWIKEIAKRENIQFIDTASVLKDAEGWLNKDLHNGDGLHLNSDGCQMVIDYIAKNINIYGE